MSIQPEPDVLVARRLQSSDCGSTCASTEDRSKGRQSSEETSTLHVGARRLPWFNQNRPSWKPPQCLSQTLNGSEPNRILLFLETNTNNHDPSGEPETGDWGLDPSLGAQLVELFFENVQNWLPILHWPKFAARFIRRTGGNATVVDRSAVSDDEAFVMYSIFAMEARFSRSPHFEEVPPVDRGEKYASHAAKALVSIFMTLQEPSIELLQGCIMLAVYYLTAGQTGPGFVLTSVCVRFAFALSLDEIDAEHMNKDGTLNTESFEESADSWVEMEQLRRLWWSIWELDIYMKTLSREPYDFEREIRVLLPVPDCNWFRGIPVRSAFIHSRPEAVWTSLQGSPNQSSQAWFLLANYLKSCISFSRHHLSEIPTSITSSLETALSKFKLSLPAEFQLRSLFINNQNYEEASRVISTHLVIIACENLLTKPSDERHDVDSPTSARGIWPFAKRTASYLVNIAQVWPPEYIPLSHPMLCCAVIPPATIDTQQCEYTTRAQEVAGLILSHYAKYWTIGSEMLRVLTATRQALDTCATSSSSDGQHSDLLPTTLIANPGADFGLGNRISLY